MRKFAFFLTLMMGLGFVACDTNTEPEGGPVDPIYPAPEAVIVDDEAYTNGFISLLFDGSAAVKAGAKSFTSTLTPDNGEQPITLTKDATSADACNHIHRDLPGGVYTVSVFATYTEEINSEVVFATDSKGVAAKYRIGVALTKPVITSAVATTDKIIVKWNKVNGATGYIFEYKEEAAAEYTVVELESVFEYTIENLKGETNYMIRIRAVESISQSKSEYSDVAQAKTITKASFPLAASNADEFIAILSKGEQLRTAAITDEIQIKGNLDFTGKTLPAAPMFTGTVNGNNFTISNLKADHPIFAAIGNAKDLTIDESCAISASKAGAVAALAGEATGTYITNVVNKAAVSVVMTAATDATVVVGGIVAISSAKMENCKNYGAITYTNLEASHGALIAGLAGYCDGAIAKCENHGNITMSIPTLSNHGLVKNTDQIPVHIGGLVANLGVDAPMTESVNNGNIDYDITNIEDLAVSCDVNRPRMGGLVGMTRSSITSCVNNGKVDVNVATSNGTTYSSNEYPINVGGISGGAPSDQTGASGADITECVNNGEVTCVTYCKGIEPTCGGIVAYPGFLDPSQTNLITRCENKGVINATTFAIARVGGIAGCSGNVTYCKNTGDINGRLSIEDGNIGGIIGWLDKGHKFEYNESYCKLSNTRVEGTSGTSEVGGLVGQHGNYDSCPGEGRGCIVQCDISYDYSNEKWYGMILGYFWSTAHTVVMGTPEEPIKVLGGSMTYSGGTTPVTAENYTQYTNHSSNGGKSGSKPFTVHVKFGN